MDVTPLIRKGQQIIQSYANGVFKISGITHETSVFVTPDETRPLCDFPSDFSQCTAVHISALKTDLEHYDVLLLGTGKEMHFLAPDMRLSLKKDTISPDMMTTGAACRTYNVLMAEGRRVACILFPT